MILEARSRSCFSSHYILTLDQKTFGDYQGRWFSEGVDIRLHGQRRLHLNKSSWLGSRFELTNQTQTLCNAKRYGFLTSRWDLELSAGSAQFVSAGFFNTGYKVIQQSRTIAEVNRIGVCDGGWQAISRGNMNEFDLLFIGLIYRTILERRRNSG